MTRQRQKTNKVLITGGAGFIGYHLASSLIADGHLVTIADDFFRGKKDRSIKTLAKNRNLRIIQTDLTEQSSWKKIGGGYDYIYHLASINGTKLFYQIPHEVLRIGIKTTLNVLEWMINKNGNPEAKILYTSSNEAYAGALDAFNSLPLPTPENVPLVIPDVYNPRWSYAGQKLIGELLFINYAKSYNLRIVIVRPHNFYGPRAGYGHVIPEMIERVNKKEDPFTIFGPQETRSFCFIEDAVEAMRKVMETKKTDNGIYHIGSGIETRIEELAKKIFALMNWHPRRIVQKKSVSGSVKRRVPDISKLKNELGWQTKTDLNTGLRKTIEWYTSKNSK